MATTNEELKEQWYVETDPKRRELLLTELESKGLLPSDIDFEEQFGLYPDIEDDNFTDKSDCQCKHLKLLQAVTYNYIKKGQMIITREIIECHVNIHPVQ